MAWSIVSTTSVLPSSCATRPSYTGSYETSAFATTAEENSARNEAERAAKAGFSLIVAAGGDGTINEVVNGIAGLKKRPQLGIIPAGTTNDYARALKIPRESPVEAAKVIAAGKTVKMDIGMANDNYFVNGHLKIDYIAQSVYVNDKEIHLMPIEYNLLCLLSKNIGRVLTHQYILDKVWVNSIESDLSSLRVYVTSLRKKIEKISNEKYIQTHVGVGYKMIKIDNSDVEDKNNE